MMRDSEIYARISHAEKRAATAQRQSGFLDFRIQALEAVLLDMSLWDFLFSRGKLIKRVDMLHMAMMQKHDDQVRQAMEEAQKPKIVVPDNKIQVVR